MTAEVKETILDLRLSNRFGCSRIKFRLKRIIGLSLSTRTIYKILKRLDVLGYTIGIASKMTAFAKPNQIVIGQLVYDVLDRTQRSIFKVLPVSSDVWSYVSNKTGDIYSLYGSSKL